MSRDAIVIVLAMLCHVDDMTVSKADEMLAKVDRYMRVKDGHENITVEEIVGVLGSVF